MEKINLSLTEDEQSALDDVAAEQGFASTEAYVQDLVRSDLEMRRFKARIQAGLDAPTTGPVDESYIAAKRRLLADRHKASA